MKRNEPTIVVKATQTVDGFEKVYKMLQQQVVLRGLSKSTSENYIRRVALSCLHFGRLPEDISEEEINEYLAALASNPQKPSRSTFEHAIYGLRYYFIFLLLYKRFRSNWSKCSIIGNLKAA